MNHLQIIFFYIMCTIQMWTCTTYFNIAADQVHPSWQWYCLTAVASFRRILHPIITLQKWFNSDSRGTTRFLVLTIEDL